MDKFILDGRYGDLLKFHGINLDSVLKKAKLPGDTFAHKTPTLTEAEYYRFMEAIGTLSDGAATAIKLSTTNKIENFSPPIFAAYCSKNGRVCIERLARYKKLIGPMAFVITEDSNTVSVEMKSQNSDNHLPQFLVACETAFLVGIIRNATGENIVPDSVTMEEAITNEEYTRFIGADIQKGSNVITFNKSNLEKPFISFDENMWSFFEPELNKRLSELEVDDSMSARVRSAITEMLPGGVFGIEDVAERLGVSKRTLQRKLSEENTSFQKQLNSTREVLAKHYINNTDMTTNDIAFLLGYAEINSFLRAFTIWTGMSISEYKKQ